MPPFTLGPLTFPSKGAAKAEFRRILNDAQLGFPLAGDDQTQVVELLRSGRHPEAAEKIGPGVAAIVVRPASYGQRCFWVERSDGTSVDFSYLTALNGPASPKVNVVAALREEIDDQIRAFRAECRDVGLCGICLRAVNEPGHIDHHDPTFDALATRFAEAAGGWEKIEIECVGAVGRQLRDRELAQVWQAFHQHAARLRLTHATCNLTRKRGVA